MGLSHGWLSPFLMICTERVNKSKLLAIPMMYNISTPSELTHIPTWRLIFLPAKTTLKTHWPNDLQLWSHHLTKYLILWCVQFFFLPSLIGPQPVDFLPLFFYVLNLRFDDLLLTHGIDSSNSQGCVKQPKTCLLLFCLTEERTFKKQKERNQGFCSQTI